MLKTSFLDAVNTCLRVLGEQPVSSVSDPLPPVATAAVANINETSREIQARGWHFNTELAYPLVRNGSDEIPLPTNTLRVDVEDWTVDVVERNGKLYDLKASTFIFSKDFEAELVMLLEFEELPEPARNYIMIRAARKTVDRYQQGLDSNPYSARDEQQAMLDLKDFDSTGADYTIWDNYSAGQIINRPRPWLRF